MYDKIRRDIEKFIEKGQIFGYRKGTYHPINKIEKNYERLWKESDEKIEYRLKKKLNSENTFSNELYQKLVILGRDIVENYKPFPFDLRKRNLEKISAFLHKKIDDVIERRMDEKTYNELIKTSKEEIIEMGKNFNKSEAYYLDTYPERFLKNMGGMKKSTPCRKRLEFKHPADK